MNPSIQILSLESALRSIEGHLWLVLKKITMEWDRHTCTPTPSTTRSSLTRAFLNLAMENQAMTLAGLWRFRITSSSSEPNAMIRQELIREPPIFTRKLRMDGRNLPNWSPQMRRKISALESVLLSTETLS